ncbi:hypothetical protein [Parasphingorhabdus sp.]|uniref:hypothetical protein n=1 Tax=Parasphingorhabdus sp. TaxID=2709688 RepID=UPI003267F577
MKLLSVLVLALLQPNAEAPDRIAAPLAPLTDEQQRDLSCVAILAIVASEQEKANETALRYPLLADRGAQYAGMVGEAVMAETGRTREQVRAGILEAVASHQARVRQVDTPDDIIAAQMAICMPLLDAVLPPKPKPSLNQCAAMLQLAYEAVYAREKLSKTAQDLKTLAFVLDNRAREELKKNGYSGTESDIILTRIREEMQNTDRSSNASSDDLDIDHCFALAAPKPKDQKIAH